MNIPALLQTRADCLAKLEYLTGRAPHTDAEERNAFESALFEAKQSYMRAEENYQRAVSTMTAEEILEATGGTAA